MSVLSITIQVILATIVLFVVYRVSLWILKRDSLVSTENNSRSQLVPIVSGHAQLSMLHNKSFNTKNAYSRNYLPLSPSFNRRGGIQFSYSFWMNMRETSNSSVRYKNILLKGDPKVGHWTKKVHDPEILGGRVATQKGASVFVKCPRIMFGATQDSFIVQLNTIHDPNATMSISRIKHGHVADRRNIMSLMHNRWALYTFTFEDHMDINNFEQGIIIKFYVNELLYMTKTFKSAIRPNTESLHLFPNGGSPIQGAKIGNIMYFNYAINKDTVAEIFRRGPPTKAYNADDETSSAQPLFLSEYNKADIYNT